MRETFRTDFFFYIKIPVFPFLKVNLNFPGLGLIFFHINIMRKIDHNSVAEEIDIWLKETDVKEKN